MALWPAEKRRSGAQAKETRRKDHEPAHYNTIFPSVRRFGRVGMNKSRFPPQLARYGDFDAIGGRDALRHHSGRHLCGPRCSGAGSSLGVVEGWGVDAGGGAFET